MALKYLKNNFCSWKSFSLCVCVHKNFFWILAGILLMMLLPQIYENIFLWWEFDHTNKWWSHVAKFSLLKKAKDYAVMIKYCATIIYQNVSHCCDFLFIIFDHEFNYRKKFEDIKMLLLQGCHWIICSRRLYDKLFRRNATIS